MVLQNLALVSQVQLKEQLTRETLASGIKELDGFPRGAITEISGSPSSGRTSVLHSFLASATTQGEHCVLVDACSSFDPHSAAAAGADLQRILWVRCDGSLDRAFQCADLLIHSGGWGAMILDLGDVAPQLVRRIPISYWYRFRRAVENTPAVMMVIEREPYVKACAAMALEMLAMEPLWSGRQADFRLLRGARVQVTPKKPVRSQFRFEARALA